MATVSGESTHASNKFSLSTIYTYITWSGEPDLVNRNIKLTFNIYAYSKGTSSGGQTGMDFHLGKWSGTKYAGTFNLKVANTSIATNSSYGLYYKWSESGAKPPKKYKVDNFGTKITKTLNYADDGSLSFKLNFTLEKSGVLGLATGKKETVEFNISETITLPSIGANWTAPSTSGFWVSRSPANVKPDGTISCSCGGLSGGSGNGTYHAYRMYFTVYRGGNKYSEYSLGEGSSFSFSPSSYYKPRIGDSIFVHGVGRTKNSSGTVYDLIDKCYQENGSNVSTRIYKNGIVYYKNSSGTLTEVTMVYMKDTGGNKQKVRYIPVKDTGGTQHIIDMYTTYYE